MAERELGREEAEAVMAILVGSLGGTVKALAKLAPIFDDEQIYQMTYKSAGAMMETREGIELARGLLALSLTKQIRQGLEASGV